jgi:hypothetical protein
MYHSFGRRSDGNRDRRIKDGLEEDNRRISTFGLGASHMGLWCGLMGFGAGPEGKSLPSPAHGPEPTACVLRPLHSTLIREEKRKGFAKRKYLSGLS